MLCDNCRERESKINFTTVEQDTKVTLHLCEQCAQQKGIETDANLSDRLHPTAAASDTRSSRGARTMMRSEHRTGCLNVR